MEGKLIIYKATLTEKLKALQEIDNQVLEKIDDAEAIATETPRRRQICVFLWKKLLQISN